MFKAERQPYDVIKNLPYEAAREYTESVGTMPLKYFCPNGVQEDVVVTLVGANKITKVPRLLVTYANGTGKTTIVVHIIANLIFGVQNGWFNYPLFKNFPYPKKIWYCSTPELIKDKFTPEL